MNIRNEIKAYIAASGWTLSDIVKEMNKARAPEDQTTPQNISNQIQRVQRDCGDYRLLNQVGTK